MDSNNSVSTLLPQLLRLFNNSVEGFQKISEAVTGSEETVAIDYTDEAGLTQRIFVPSIGYLNTEIQRLDQNVQAITNFNPGTSSSIRLADGTFRKLVLKQLSTEADDLQGIGNVSTFSTKSNWFFESLMTPMIYVSFNISGQAPINTENVIVKRYILQLDSAAKLNYYFANFDGQSEINYRNFLQSLLSQGISYILDEDTVDLPPRTLRYTGSFSVLRISDTQTTEVVNGVSVTKTRKIYKLNKLAYTDTTSNFIDTVGLKVGDSLVVNSDPIDTRYTVSSVDTSTNSVVLELVEGSRGIEIGADILKIYSTQDDNLQVQVSIGFDEYCVVFIKAIDPDSKIPSTNWSLGSGFYTNTLTTTLPDGNTYDFATYYRQRVVDFGKYVMGLADNKIPTAQQGITPVAPTVSATDFQVLQINQQITDSKSIQTIQQQVAEKNTLSSELSQLDSAISQKRATIATKNYKSTIERDADQNQLTSLVDSRASKSQLYNSVVKSISAIATDTGIGTASPKYRVRGFWPMPTPQVSPETGEQQVVQFIVQYRYLSPEGAANPVQTIDVSSDTGNSSGAFSNWNEVVTTPRKRIYDTNQNKFVWQSVDIQNANQINTNQLDIPIQKGEQVEIRIASVSEAGYPASPLISDFSSSVVVAFPENLNENGVGALVLENNDSLVKVQLEEDLQSRGLNEHLSSQFTANEKYFAHTASTIYSGFVSDNQTPIDLQTYITNLQNRITFLEESLAQITGELSVTLIDDAGNVYNLRRDDITSVFAGYYVNEVDSLTTKKGAIVSKTFFVTLSNQNQSSLELVSRVFGTNTLTVRESEDPSASGSSSTILPAIYSYYDNYDTYVSSNSDYNTIYKYDLVPMLLTSSDVTVGSTAGVNNRLSQPNSISPYASSQVKGQFIYSRYYDVAGEENFYSYVNPSSNNITNLDESENYYTRSSDTGAVVGGEFIWGGGFDVAGDPTTASAYASSDDCIELHISHPYISSSTVFDAQYAALFNDTITTLNSSATDYAKVLFRNSTFAPLTTNSTLGKKQSIYIFEDLDNMPQYGQAASATYSTAGLTSFKRSNKISFEPNDQFLLGKQSCGSYLFFSSPTHSDISVDGRARSSAKTISFGNTNSISIPLVFQYRMTDYYGSGNSGTGNIGGDITGATLNLTYAKRVGFDILDSNNNLYSFDIEIFAKYLSDTLSEDTFPVKSVQTSIDDVSQVLNRLSPNILPG